MILHNTFSLVSATLKKAPESVYQYSADQNSPVSLAAGQDKLNMVMTGNHSTGTFNCHFIIIPVMHNQNICCHLSERLTDFVFAYRKGILLLQEPGYLSSPACPKPLAPAIVLNHPGYAGR